MNKLAVFVVVSFVLVSSLLNLSQGDDQPRCRKQIIVPGTCAQLNCGASFPASAQARNCSCRPASAQESRCECDVVTCGEDNTIEPTSLGVH
ncbi:hypothetical protein RGQ29_029585 [Quercus rubra]|uniref:Uncharacterized protein n=1 Tax=Quercus rubra TaxID=3512 RepID=A0AAN7EF82_QUERU|nr:hypothetical protein RGQ29_029585 [Quercus rubra]